MAKNHTISREQAIALVKNTPIEQWKKESDKLYEVHLPKASVDNIIKQLDKKIPGGLETQISHLKVLLNVYEQKLFFRPRFGIEVVIKYSLADRGPGTYPLTVAEHSGINDLELKEAFEHVHSQFPDTYQELRNSTVRELVGILEEN